MGKDIVETKKSKEWAPAEKYAAAVALYGEKGNAAIDEIAADLGKNRREVISKFVADKIYVKPEKAPKKVAAKVEGPQKKELIATVKELTGFNSEVLEGFNGVTKPTLAALVDFLKENKSED